MMNELLSSVLAFASTLAVIVLALVQLVKVTVNLPKNWIPMIGTMIGILIGAAAYPFTDLDWVPRVWAGGLAGLSATGLFELVFNPKDGKTQDSGKIQF